MVDQRRADRDPNKALHGLLALHWCIASRTSDVTLTSIYHYWLKARVLGLAIRSLP